MKTSHILFFLILFLILRGKAKTQVVPVALTGGDAMLRRDMDEKYDLLLERIEKLESSPYQ